MVFARKELVFNDFNTGEEGWCSYDYTRSARSRHGNFFILAGWRKFDGVDNSPFIFSDDSRWSIDIPETPFSILPLLFYSRWLGSETLDLRNRKVSFYLRGWELELGKAQPFFWIVGGNARWHFLQPLLVTDEWTKNEFILDTDSSKWRVSWFYGYNIVNQEREVLLSTDKPCPLPLSLENTQSYGIAFVGFSEFVTGILGMDDFIIE